MSRQHYATVSEAIRRERAAGGDEGTLLGLTHRLASAFQWQSLKFDAERFVLDCRWPEEETDPYWSPLYEAGQCGDAD
jgi:hypothetical protein